MLNGAGAQPELWRAQTRAWGRANRPENGVTIWGSTLDSLKESIADLLDLEGPLARRSVESSPFLPENLVRVADRVGSHFL